MTQNQDTGTPLAADLCWIGVATAVTLLGLFCLSAHDLGISLSLVGERESFFGRLIQEWGRLPARLLVVGSALVLAFRALRLKYSLLCRLAAALVVQFVLQPAVFTNLLKLLAGRPRPVNIGLDGAGFAPFYVFSPGFGDFSFPSGHVAVAMILMPCVVLLWRARERWAALGVALFTAVWAGAVACGRVVSGAHFPTDVVLSIGVGVAFAPVSLRLGSALSRRLTRPERQPPCPESRVR